MAAAAGFAALDVFLLALCALLLVLIVGGLLYLVLSRAQSWAGSLPWPLSGVGQLFAWLLGFVLDFLHSIESLLWAAVVNVLSGWYRLIRATIGGFLDWATGWIYWTVAQVRALVALNVPGLVAEVVALQLQVAGLATRLAYLEGPWGNKVVNRLDAEAAATGALAATLSQVTLTALPAVLGRLSANERALASDAAQLATLGQFLRLLQGLAAWEGTIGGQLTDELGQIARQREAIGQLQSDLAKVLPLSIVVALGLSAIQTLTRVAEDPCYCFNQGVGSDLLSRVASLESLGP